MAWNLRTWLFGETITAAKLNEIRDALLECAPGKVSGVGQIPVGDGVNSLTALAAPVLGQILGESDGMPTWIDGCLLSAQNTSASQAASSITFNSELFDTSGFANLGTNADRLTIPAGLGGVYIIIAKAEFAYSAATNDWDRALNVSANAGSGTTPAFGSSLSAKQQAIHGGTSGYDNEPTIVPMVDFAGLYPGNYLTMNTYASNGEVAVNRSAKLAAIRLFSIPS